MNSCRPLRVLGSKVLKSWSRSTIDVVLSCARTRALVELRGVVRAGRERDVAVGHARERGGADERRRALVQGRELVPDRDLDRGLVVVGQRDRVHRADAPAPDLDVVALDDLARVGEAQLVLGAAAAEEEQPPHDEDRGDERADGEAAGGGHATDGVWGAVRVSVRGAGGASSCPVDVAVVLRHSIPSGPWDSPERNWRTKALSESNSSSAGPDSTMRPFHSTEMCSATRRALMMSWVMTT